MRDNNNLKNESCQFLILLSQLCETWKLNWSRDCGVVSSGFRGLGSLVCVLNSSSSWRPAALAFPFLILQSASHHDFCSLALMAFPVANICPFTLHAISPAMKEWPLHAAPSSVSLSPPIQSSTARWWRTLLLVLIQFDISYYGSSEARTMAALEIDQDRNHFFCAVLSLS